MDVKKMDGCFNWPFIQGVDYSTKKKIVYKHNLKGQMTPKVDEVTNDLKTNATQVVL